MYIYINIYIYLNIYILKKKRNRMKNNLDREDAALEASVNAVFCLHLSQLFSAEAIDF